jgi:hypothetical protein
VTSKPKVRESRRKEVALPTDLFRPRFWEDQDGRSVIVREIRERVEALERDSGSESYQQRSLCQRAIFIELQLESLEIVATQGDSVDMGSFTQMVNCLQGIYAKLGLKKQVKSIDLKTYVKERSA